VIAATAARILASFERLFVPDSETVPMDMSQYDPATRAWHESMTRDLEGEGFRALGDFTSATAMAARKGERPPAFSRKFLSADGKIRATAIFVAAARPGQPDIQIIGLNSESDHGKFLRTTTAVEKWDARTI
jgi:hypothetical protein